jgi:hypothetical protein
VVGEVVGRLRSPWRMFDPLLTARVLLAALRRHGTVISVDG